MVNIGSISSGKVPDKETFNSWKDQLFQSCDSLHVLTTTTESEFVAIGRAMADFHERAKETIQMASSLLGIMSGNDITRAIQDIEDLLNRVRQNLSKTEAIFTQDLKTLQQTLITMSVIQKPLESFKKLVKILKILSISTKIESAQLSQDQAGFITLADNVERLSVEIDEETKKIAGKALLLDTIVRQNISQISSLEKNQYTEIHVLLNDIGCVLIFYKDKNKLSRKGADLISDQSEKISRHIGEVVVSIQFHDIIRQIIEHVKEALDNLAHKVDRESLQNSIEKKEENSSHIGIIHEVADICELQRIQLDEAKQKIVGTTRNIIDHLLQIKENTMEVSRKAHNLAGIADESSLSFVSKVEGGISSAAESLGAFSRAHRDLSATMDIFLSTTADVSGSVDGIKEIGTEIELIALNARIKAAHTGDKGAPLGVIAKAIQKLSSDANMEKTAISTTLNNVVLAAHDIRLYTHKNVDYERSEEHDALRDFGVLADMFRAEKGKITSMLNNIGKSGERLASDIERLVSSITVHEKFEIIINNVMSILGLVSKESGQLAQRAESGNKSEYLRHLKDNYTMHRERKIHSQFTSLDTGSTTKPGADKDKIAVEFTNTKPETHQEFGDNVELF